MAVARLASCAPDAPPPPTPYLDVVYSDIHTTAKAAPLTYGSAPPVDPTVGPNDPHGRPLDANGNEILRVWMSDPRDNTATNRPAIILVHGGGFKAGIGSGYGLLNNVGLPYAQRGYVVFSIEYRVDTTSDCQWVQDHDPSTPGYDAMRAQCEQAIIAAQRDTQAAIRWVRANAATWHIQGNRIAVGGFSAGAVTASNVAYRSDDAGDWSYRPGDDPHADSSARATFGASGCEYLPESIGAGDAPTSFIASELDQAVDYHSCVAPTTVSARAAGLVAELTSYCDQGGHALDLYTQHRAATDAQWTTFLARQLNIYGNMRPPSADPVCS